MPSHVITLCWTSELWRAAKGQCQVAAFMLYIYLKISSKLAINTLLNRAEYTITRDRVFLFPCLKISKHSNRWTQCNHHEPSCGVHSCWEGRETPSVSPLPLAPLCSKLPCIPCMIHAYSLNLCMNYYILYDINFILLKWFKPLWPPVYMILLQHESFPKYS